MPRSGTSLVEQILSTHKDVFGGGELSFIEDYLLKNRGSIGLRLPEILSNPNKENIKNFHNFYYEKLKYLNFNAKYITDKMPGNFKWIGLIKSAFPNSKIIHLIIQLEQHRHILQVFIKDYHMQTYQNLTSGKQILHRKKVTTLQFK